MPKKLKELLEQKRLSWNKEQVRAKILKQALLQKKQTPQRVALLQKLERRSRSYEVAAQLPLKPRQFFKKKATVLVEQFQKYLVIKFKNSLDIRFSFGLPKSNDPDLNYFFRTVEGQWVREINSAPESKLREIKKIGEMRSGNELADFSLMFRLLLPDEATAKTTYEYLITSPFVEYVSINEENENADLPPAFLYYSATTDHQQYHIGVGGTIATDGLRVTGAWNYTTGEGVKVCTHDSYAPNINHINLNPSLTIFDDGKRDNHATESIGVLHAQNNIENVPSWGTVGIAYGANGYASCNAASTLYPLTTWGFGPGDVISYSLHSGYAIPNNGTNPTTTYLPIDSKIATYDAIATLMANGITICIAAGNTYGDGQDLQDHSDYFSHDPWDSGFLGHIIVGAGVRTSLNKSSYSGYSSNVAVKPVRLFAKTDMVAPSVITVVNENYQPFTDETYFSHVQADADYRRFGGTSCATPQIAGCCALLQSYAYQQFGYYIEPDQIKDVLYDLAINPDSSIRYGRLYWGITATADRPRFPNIEYALINLGLYLGETEEEGQVAYRVDNTTVITSGKELSNLTNYQLVSQAEAETGTLSSLRAWSPLRVKQAIVALGSSGSTINSTLTVTVGPTGTYNNLSSAIADLMTMKKTMRLEYVTIVLQSTYKLTECFYIREVDLSWIGITSNGATININYSSVPHVLNWYVRISSGRRPVFGVTNGKLPMFYNIKFTFGSSLGSIASCDLFGIYSAGSVILSEVNVVQTAYLTGNILYIIGEAIAYRCNFSRSSGTGDIARLSRGGQLYMEECDFRSNGTESYNDIQLYDSGNIVRMRASYAGLSVTKNTINSEGIIFRDN